MKKLVLALAMVASLGFASDEIEVNGKKAENIINALKKAGVEFSPGFEMSRMEVRDLKVEYTPRGFIYSQGTLTDKKTGKQLRPVAAGSFDIYSALKEAGVPSLELEGFIGTSIVSAKEIECARGYNIGSHSTYSYCLIYQ